MTAQLIAAMATTDRDTIVEMRAMLLASGHVALEERSPLALVYAGLSTALGFPSRDIDPRLQGAVVAASERDPNVVESVAGELLEVAAMPGAAANLLTTLARELRMAAAAVAIDLAAFDEELRRTDSPDELS